MNTMRFDVKIGPTVQGISNVVSKMGHGQIKLAFLETLEKSET